MDINTSDKQTSVTVTVQLPPSVVILFFLPVRTLATFEGRFLYLFLAIKITSSVGGSAISFAVILTIVLEEMCRKRENILTT